MHLKISSLRVRYGSVLALDGIDLELAPGEMFFLLGPSGCGKSTLLRTVAGFIDEFEGSLTVDGTSLHGIPAHKRDFGMVFQNYALFPHLTVSGNVAFGLEARKVGSAEIQTRVAEALKLVGLSGYEARKPGELSGGQQQRVALARALVIKPRILLLDEPLSNLDAKLRWEMRSEIKRIHRLTGVTTLYVTHDQQEALSLADRMAILKEGRIEALGTPRELYHHPATRFAASFMGDANFLEATVIARKDDALKLKAGDSELQYTLADRSAVFNVGEMLTLFCRPEKVVLGRQSEALHLTAQIETLAYLGERTLLEVRLENGTKWHVLATDAASLQEGKTVELSIAERDWRIIPTG